MGLFTETWFVGLATMLFGLFVTTVWLFFVKLLMSASMFDMYYPYYNQLTTAQYITYTFIFATLLFLTGVVIHLVAEFSGINAWYCKNGNACARKVKQD